MKFYICELRYITGTFTEHKTCIHISTFLANQAFKQFLSIMV